MKRILSNSSIILFFCILMGGIIMLDSIIAIDHTKQLRGIANHFSNSTVRFSVLQADIPDSFTQGDLLQFIEENSMDIKNFSCNITSKNGSELYSSMGNCFHMSPDNTYGVWLRDDQYQEWEKSEKTSFFYKNHWYTVLGSYSPNQASESFILDMKGELIQNPDTAMNGIFYLDCEENSLNIYQALVSRIQETYPYAQVSLMEDQANGYTFSRIVESEDSLYYLLQMGLLVFLNLLNFGNIAGYWVQQKEREIFVRRMAGGSYFHVYMDLILPFSIVTLIFIGIGMLMGFLIGSLLSTITIESIYMGSFIGIIQWFILLIFGSCILIRKVRLPIIYLKKSET